MRKDILDELLKFSPKLLSLGAALEEKWIQRFEQQQDLELPADYKAFIQLYNGMFMMGTEVYGVSSVDDPTADESAMSLEKCYHIEHFQVQEPLPLYLVPFSPDGRGNHYCFDIRKISADSCPVVFYQYGYEYSENEPPEAANDSFSAWVKEVLIDWTLEDFDYDGNEKQDGDE